MEIQYPAMEHMAGNLTKWPREVTYQLFPIQLNEMMTNVTELPGYCPKMAKLGKNKYIVYVHIHATLLHKHKKVT